MHANGCRVTMIWSSVTICLSDSCLVMYGLILDIHLLQNQLLNFLWIDIRPLKLQLWNFSFIFAIALVSPANNSYAISFSKPDTASVSHSASFMKASEFIKLSPGEFSVVTGKKLSFFEKASLKILQMKMKRFLKKILIVQ